MPFLVVCSHLLFFFHAYCADFGYSYESPSYFYTPISLCLTRLSFG